MWEKADNDSTLIGTTLAWSESGPNEVALYHVWYFSGEGARSGRKRIISRRSWTGAATFFDDFVTISKFSFI